MLTHPLLGRESLCQPQLDNVLKGRKVCFLCESQYQNLFDKKSYLQTCVINIECKITITHLEWRRLIGD